MGAGDEHTTIVVLVDGDVEVIIGRVQGVRPDVALIDALMRLQLAARRRGCTIRLREPCEQLCELLDVVGLGDVVAGSPGSGFEVRWKAEGGEQLGIEEVVNPGEPSV